MEDGSLPYSLRAPMYRLPETVQWDAMQCIWASGGIGQYEVNQFVREVTHQGLPLAQVEARVNTPTYIQTINKLTNNAENTAQTEEAFVRTVKHRTGGQWTRALDIERHHRRCKRIAAFCFRNLGSKMVRRSTMNTLQVLTNPRNFHAAKLVVSEDHPFYPRSRSYQLLRYHGLRGCARQKTMRSCTGLISRGDSLLYDDGTNTWAGGVVVELCLAAPTGGCEDHFVIIRKHLLTREEDTPTSSLFRTTLHLLVVHHQRILHDAPYILDALLVRV